MAESPGQAQALARVVVGVDGSAGSLQALQWALREAQLRGAPVHAVLAWQFHPSWSDSALGRMFPTDFGSGIGDASGMPAPLESDDLAPGTPESGVRGSSRRTAAEEVATNVLDAAIAEALAGRIDSASHSSVTVTEEVVEGHAAKVLLDAVTGSDLLVVGSRGHGGFAGALLGSISQHIVSHASCPVVVVPAP